MGYFVSFIPTATEEVRYFFDLAPVSSADVVYDLGSGDGRLVFAAIERGAGRAVGVELNAVHVRECRELARKKGLESRVAFIEADLMDVDLSDATVVVTYLFSSASAALKPKFETELKAGTRIVMESFPVHGWKPKQIQSLEHRTFYLYSMPPQFDLR